MMVQGGPGIERGLQGGTHVTAKLESGDSMQHFSRSTPMTDSRDHFSRFAGTEKHIDQSICTACTMCEGRFTRAS